jgi:hypothetical protein
MADVKTDAGKETPKPDAEVKKDDAAKKDDAGKPAEGEGADDAAKKDTPKAEGDSGTEGDGAKPKADTVPEEYDLTLPEGSPFAEADLVGFAAEAKAMGLTNDAAQAMVKARAEQIAQAADRYLTELKADPDMGGDKLEATVAIAAKGRDVLFPPGSEEADLINDWFERTGLGNHKLLVRAFARLGRMVAEDGVKTPGKGADGGKPKKSAAEVLYGSED